MSAVFAEQSFADRLLQPPILQWTTSPRPEISWHEIAQRAPQMASTMATYLDQLTVSARPGTVGAFDIALRFFAGRVTEADPFCVSVAAVERRHVEDFKRWQAARPGRKGKLSTTTIRHRLGLLRTFFERIIEWGYADAPARVPIFPGDSPRRTSRCPSSWTTEPWPSSWQLSPPIPTSAVGS
jgi:hypothetical protein